MRQGEVHENAVLGSNMGSGMDALPHCCLPNPPLCLHRACFWQGCSCEGRTLLVGDLSLQTLFRFAPELLELCCGLRTPPTRTPSFSLSFHKTQTCYVLLSVPWLLQHPPLCPTQRICTNEPLTGLILCWQTAS